MDYENLDTFCKKNKKFCNVYYDEIYRNIFKAEKKKELAEIKKIKSKTEKMLLKRKLNELANTDDVDCTLSVKAFPLIFYG